MQDVVGIGFAQGAQQAGCPIGEQVDDGRGVGGSGVDGNAEAGRELGKGVVPTQIHQTDERTLVQREHAAAVPTARGPRALRRPPALPDQRSL